MADQKVTALTEISAPTLDDLTYIVDDPAGTPISNKVTWARVLGQFFASTCEGRLTTETGVPVSTSDRAAQSTLYFTPFNGNRVALYDGTRWKLYVFTELSLALSGLTSGKPYDVFLYDNAGTLTLELLVWTNDTTRATALALQDGVWVKTGALTRRYLGTCYTSGTTTIEDTAAKRWLWNAAHRVPRPMRGVTETANSWSYTTATWRQANANAANQLDFVVGLAGDPVQARAVCPASNTSAASAAVGIGVDSTSVNSAQIFGANVAATTAPIPQLTGWYDGITAVGRHTLVWLEIMQSGGSGTFYGDNGLTYFQAGITGTVPA